MIPFNYFIHLLLYNRYKKIFDFLLLFTIFIIMKEGHYAFCMNDTNIPNIAEPKVPILRGIQIMTPLQREVSEFLGAAETIQKQSAIILEQQATMSQLETEHAVFRSNAENYANALILDRQNLVNILKTDVSKKVIIHNADGTQTERHIIVPEDLNRIKDKMSSLKKMSFVFGISTLLLGGYYLLSQGTETSELQSATEMLVNQKEVIDSIASLKK